jgi:periplasmic divalent cation tolerance protein
MLLCEVTCKDESEAIKIANAVVRERLAACANVIPLVTSFFYWENAFRGDKEAIIFMKTSEAKRKKLEKRVKQLHSYKCPAIIFWKAQAVKEYERWLKKELKRK